MQSLDSLELAPTNMIKYLYLNDQKCDVLWYNVAENYMIILV
jgi:hypothetical protein